jgi:tetratricopeptide (TPR) repeat protein
MTPSQSMALTNKRSAEACYLRGRFFHDQQNWKKAILFYQQAIDLDPSFSEACNDLGAVFQRLGQFQEAVNWYHKALSIDPFFAEAWYNLGNIFKEMKDWDQTISCSRRAVELDPGLSPAYYNLGVAFYQKGLLEEAVGFWQKTIELKPDNFLVYSNLGTALGRMKRLKEAASFFQTALSIDPRQPMAWVNLGNIRKEQGEIEEAITYYRKALTIDPELPEGYINLGFLAVDQGHLDGAVLFFQKTVELDPYSAENFFNLGNVYKDKQEINKSIESFQEAIRLRPDYHQALNNLALLLHGQGRLEEAIAFFYQALEARADEAEIFNNLGNVYKDQKRMEQAVEAYRRAVNLNPTYPEGHWNLALALLMTRNFEQGWPEYEWRWKIKGVISRGDFERPLWDGRPLEGKRILLYAEQGFGDTVQFIRYVPSVLERGGRVVVECQPELVSLLQTMKGIEAVIPHGNPLPNFDVQCPLLSLPLIFRTDLSTIPSPIPYLRTDPEKVQKWRDRLASDQGNYKVGLVWAGKPDHSNDHNRSISFNELWPLFLIPGISFYGLQRGTAAMPAKESPPGPNWVNLSDELYDFSETGAAIQNLDLIISVDTAVAHLAGALGRPVWTLLPFAPDWRWLLDREDTPWYPTMKLFRQTTFRQWAGAIKKVAAQLIKVISG